MALEIKAKKSKGNRKIENWIRAVKINFVEKKAKAKDCSNFIDNFFYQYRHQRTKSFFSSLVLWIWGRWLVMLSFDHSYFWEINSKNENRTKFLTFSSKASGKWRLQKYLKKYFLLYSLALLALNLSKKQNFKRVVVFDFEEFFQVFEHRSNYESMGPPKKRAKNKFTSFLTFGDSIEKSSLSILKENFSPTRFHVLYMFHKWNFKTCKPFSILSNLSGTHYHILRN